MSNNDNDWFYSGEQFQAFFEKACQSLILKANPPHFKVLAVSDEYLELTHKHRSDLLGKNLFEVFPGSEADLSEQFSVVNSFKKIIKSKAKDELPIFKYEIYVPQTHQMETQYWSNINEPILDAEGNVAYIINKTNNITEQVLNLEAQEKAVLLEESLGWEQNLNEELAAANEELRTINDELNESQQNLALLNRELEERVARRTKALAESEAMLTTAIASAKLGTWFINIYTREFIASPRTKELFGFYPTETMSFNSAIKQITEEYREQVINAVEAAIQQGERYNMEYPVMGFRDGKLRWLNATGKTYQEKDGKQPYFSGTIIDITEHKMDDIRKNDFIAMVSHELKTPLTSLKAYVQMLAVKARKTEDPFTVIALEKVNAQIKKMTTMINSFLNIARLESGKIHLDKTNFNLDELIRETVEETRLTSKSHIIDFAPCEPLPVFADEEKIGQVINNLISNAIKYSPKGKHIDISCAKIGNMVQFRVKDEGMGVPPQDANKIFERFYRVESNYSHTVSGFGIGLYLCYEILQHHNGKINIESEPGQGSTFYFNLPIA